MAYRKTEKVLAQLAAKRNILIDAAIEIIERDGIAALTSDKVAAESGSSVGGFYKHFPDKVELFAALVARELATDCAAMTEATADSRDALGRLHAALLALYKRFRRRRVRSALLADPAYREGLQRALRPLIRDCVDDDAAHARVLSAAILGALQGLHESGHGSPIVAADFALRGIGTPTRKLPEITTTNGSIRPRV